MHCSRTAFARNVKYTSQDAQFSIHVQASSALAHSALETRRGVGRRGALQISLLQMRISRCEGCSGVTEVRPRQALFSYGHRPLTHEGEGFRQPLAMRSPNRNSLAREALRSCSQCRCAALSENGRWRWQRCVNGFPAVRLGCPIFSGGCRGASVQMV